MERIPAFVERIPLYDLDDRLLGYSVRAIVAHVYVEDIPEEVERRIGLKRHWARGFNASENKIDRTWHFEWFEDIPQTDEPKVEDYIPW